MKESYETAEAKFMYTKKSLLWKASLDFHVKFFFKQQNSRKKEGIN